MNHGGMIKYIERTLAVLLGVLIFALPLVALPLTLDPLEINKQTLFVGVSCVGALLWIIAMLVREQVRFKQGWVNLFPALWILAFIIPASTSIAPYMSWFGASGQQYTSMITIFGGALLFLLLTNTAHNQSNHRRVQTILLFSAGLVALLGVLELLGPQTVSHISSALTLNTVGTLTSFTAFLIIMSGFYLISWLLHGSKNALHARGGWGLAQAVLGWLIVICAWIFLLVLDDGQLWALNTIATGGLLIIAITRIHQVKSHVKLWLPALLLVGSLAWWFVLPGLQVTTPLEVTLNASMSESIAKQTLETHSLMFGSGPGTYAINYTQFQDGRLNETDFWNTRFDRGASFIYTLIPTIGVWGTSLVMTSVLLLLIRALRQLKGPSSEQAWNENVEHLAPWLVLVASAFLVNWNMTLIGTFFMFSGLLASQMLKRDSVHQFKKRSMWSIAVAGIAVVMLLIVSVGSFLTTQRYVAHVAFAKAVALDREGAQMEEVVNTLEKATRHNQLQDTYHRNLAEARLLLLNEKISNIENIQNLNQEELVELQELAWSSIEAADDAISLSGFQALNWKTHAFIHRELTTIMGENAAKQAEQSYEMTIQLEPFNPSYFVELAKAQLVYAQWLGPLIDQDPVRAVQRTELLEEAASHLQQAVTLKPNYAPAHFQLALIYAEKGELDDAIGKMESVAAYNQLDIGVHFELAMLYLQRMAEGDLTRAQKALEQTVSLQPDHVNAYWFLASVYEQQEDVTAAVHALEKVAALDPGNELVMNRLENLLTGEQNPQLQSALEAK